jgi:ABC-type multidrug transport system fused ATPase/permease subunit
MVTLGVLSFVGAMLEAGILVLLTSTVLGLAAYRTSIGPWLGFELSIPAALNVAGAAVVIRLALAILAVRVSASLGAQVRSDQRRRVAFSYLRADWGAQQGEATGRLQEVLTTFVGRVNSAMSSLTQAITASLSLVAYLSAGLFVDPLATLAVLGGLVLLALALSPVRRLIRRQAGRVSTARED